MSQNNIWGQLLQSIAPNQNIRDYKHAARTFVDGLYRLSPKLNNLFHVFMDVNTAISSVDQLSQIETGMMAKQVGLPKFNVQNKTYNAYNRKTVQQERVNYDPVTITFHDDSANVRRLWIPYQNFMHGHVFIYKDTFIKDYVRGDIFEFDDPLALHGSANLGTVPKLRLQIVIHLNEV